MICFGQVATKPQITGEHHQLAGYPFELRQSDLFADL